MIRVLGRECDEWKENLAKMVTRRTVPSTASQSMVSPLGAFAVRGSS